MSEIKVDTLTGKTTANDITVTVGASATAKLEQGLAKMRGRGSSDGTSLQDSFNVSSLTDTATGRQTYNFTNNMSDNLYVGNASPGGSFCYSMAVEPAASSLSTRARNNLDAIFDTGVFVTAHGDLA